MKLTPRQELQTLPQVHHGAVNVQELQDLDLSPEEVIDFSVNGNPYGPPQGIKNALTRVRIDRYPDRDSWELTKALSEHHGLEPDWILPGNGSLELLWMLALSYLNQDHRVLISGPTFGEYERAARMMGAQTDLVETGPEHGLTPRIKDLTRALNEHLYQVVFLCNPNNPTGKHIAGERITQWADEYPGTLFLIDEAYLGFAVDMESIIKAHRSNILVLRSMTKDFALAGLRLGYALGHPEVIKNLSKVRPPWNVNAPAQAAGRTALQNADAVRNQLQMIHRAKQELVSGLQALGYRLVDSSTHFFLVQVGDAAAFRSRLLRSGLQVRDCASFGLPAYARISTRTPAENQRLLQTLQNFA